MERRSNYAAAKDAHIMLSKEGYALGMGQRSNFAAAKDVPINPRREEFV